MCMWGTLYVCGGPLYVCVGTLHVCMWSPIYVCPLYVCAPYVCICGVPCMCVGSLYVCVGEGCHECECGVPCFLKGLPFPSMLHSYGFSPQKYHLEANLVPLGTYGSQEWPPCGNGTDSWMARRCHLLSTRQQVPSSAEPTAFLVFQAQLFHASLASDIQDI